MTAPSPAPRQPTPAERDAANPERARAPGEHTWLGRVGGVIDRYWMAPMPAKRLAALRIAIGGFALLYLVFRLPYWLSYAHFDPYQYQPVGLLAWLLPKPLVPLAVQGLIAATIACAVPFVLGWRYRVFGPLFALLLLVTLTYRNSWGMIFHTENLMVMHILVLGLVRAADAWSLDASRPSVPSAATSDAEDSVNGRYGWPIRLMCWIVVIAYVLAGIAKLRNAGMEWLWGDELRNHIAIDNARKLLLGDIYSPIAGPLMHFDVMYRILALLTVAAELGAPLALLGRRVAALWVVVVIGFHIGVIALMMIMFPYQVFGVAFLCFFRPERWPARLRARLRREL
ncbi:MAG: hypothetical protein Tsb0020_23720 [Haliangiales bacterium]